MPPTRDRGKAQIDRRGRTPNREAYSAIVSHSGGRGIAQMGGGEGAHCYAFLRRPKA